MGKGQRDKRGYPRVVVEGKTEGKVTSVYEASLLNISLGGALIEHVEALRPGTPSYLEVELQGRRVRLRCRVARSVADRIEVQPDGERAVLYHSGMEFLDLPEDTQQVISDYIQAITGERNARSESEPEAKESMLTDLEKLEGLVKEASKNFEEGTAPTDGTV